MTIETAIQKAIEGGLKGCEGWQLMAANQIYVTWITPRGNAATVPLEVYLFDSNFWKSLGKSMGWDDYKDTPIPSYANGTVTGWKAMQHRMLDFLHEKGDVGLFFELL